MLLFNNYTGGDTTSDAEDAEAGVIEGKGASVWIVVRADNYDGATISLQFRTKEDPGSRWDDIGSGAFTEDGQVQLQALVNGSELRAALTGSGGSTTNLVVSVLEA